MAQSLEIEDWPEYENRGRLAAAFQSVKEMMVSIMNESYY